MDAQDPRNEPLNDTLGTPRQVVEQLDRHIVGQAAAKRAVAVALRNRWRRRRLQESVAEEVTPRNIIMIGPTGVGKTEIARRLAKLADAPFVKVEASKYTEVGYHGRDVESMIRDLLDAALRMVREEHARTVEVKALKRANERIIDLLLPGQPQTRDDGFVPGEASDQRREEVRRRLMTQLESGKLDEREVELTITTRPQASIMFAGMGMEQLDPEVSGLLERMMPEQTKTRRVSVAQARRILTEQETDALIDREKITSEAIRRTEYDGIVFLDEIDKIASASSASGSGGSGGSGGGGPDVSRQGVQRDLLPIVEGSTVTTRHGTVRTDHILFIAAGAFHSAKVSDLMPELQGRFPIRVELEPLTREDFVRILREPKNSLTQQQKALLAVEGLTVEFDDEAVEAIADLAARANARLVNIGARRLMTVVEKVFEQVNFDAPDRVARGETSFRITGAYVREQVESLVQDEDLSRFVL